MPAASEQIKRMAIVWVLALVFANLAFYFLSASYFASHRDIVVGVGSVATYTPALAMHVRMTFVLLSGVVTAFGFAASIAPRQIGHLLPVLLALANLAGAVGAFAHDTPAVLGVTLGVAGLLMPVLAHFSYRGSRPAWAYLVAMCGVFAVVEFFGAPKISRAIDVGLWTAMILCGLNAVAAVALASLRGSYLERSAA
jgi:hypothetical protein